MRNDLATPAAAKMNVGRVAAGREKDPLRGFQSPREFLSCVMLAYTTGRLDPRLRPQIGATLGTDEQQTQADQYGGFLVPSSLLVGFLSTTVEADPIGARVMSVPMPTPIVRIPARVDANHTTSVAGGVTVSRREETGSIPSSRLQMRQIILEARSLFGVAFASNELCMDSREAFAAVLSRAFQDEMASVLIGERLYGTGAGQFAGVLESNCLITVAKDSGQAAATISASNVVNMRSSCWGYNEAVWLANHDAYPQLATLSLGSGSAVTMLFLPTAREGEPDMLAGRPIIFSEYCQPLGSVGDIVLGNWSQYIEGTYQRGAADSVHVRWVQHESVFKFWLRNDGAPWWQAVLTPQNSTKSLSPFVTLAAR